MQAEQTLDRQKYNMLYCKIYMVTASFKGAKAKLETIADVFCMIYFIHHYIMCFKP